MKTGSREEVTSLPLPMDHVFYKFNTTERRTLYDYAVEVSPMLCLKSLKYTHNAHTHTSRIRTHRLQAIRALCQRSKSWTLTFIEMIQLLSKVPETRLT